MFSNYMKKNEYKNKSNFVEKLWQNNFKNYNFSKISVLVFQKGNYYIFYKM